MRCVVQSDARNSADAPAGNAYVRTSNVRGSAANTRGKSSVKPHKCDDES